MGIWSPRPQTISCPNILSPSLVDSFPNAIQYKCQFNKCICRNLTKLNLADNRFTFHDLSTRAFTNELEKKSRVLTSFQNQLKASSDFKI